MPRVKGNSAMTTDFSNRERTSSAGAELRGSLVGVLFFSSLVTNRLGRPGGSTVGHFGNTVPPQSHAGDSCNGGPVGIPRYQEAEVGMFQLAAIAHTGVQYHPQSHRAGDSCYQGRFCYMSKDAINSFVARQYHPQSQELGSLVTVATCGSKRLTTAPWPHSRRLQSPKMVWEYSPILNWILLTTANFGRQRLKSACFSWLQSP
jgi:hypothetical protein